MKYIVAFSGGHSSALVAIETVKKVGKENVILLNHDITPIVEHEDIKRFKTDVADYLDLPITYANADNWEEETPCKACTRVGAFKCITSPGICTYELKSKPANKYYKDNFPIEPGETREDIKTLYGFDKSENVRIQRRIGVMASKGYLTDYPLALWNRTIESTEELGIKRPITYNIFKHANCVGCLKAGKQHWYIVYCLYPHIWEEAKIAENAIGHSIIKEGYLEELEANFRVMKCRGIVPNEKVGHQRFWADINKIMPEQMSLVPCECSY